jgi:Transposase DDE domain
MIKVVDNDIETLAVALYVKIDDMLRDWPDLAAERLADGGVLTLSDAELLTMAVMSALLRFTSERRWLRYVNEYLAGMFPRRIGQSGYNKRIRKASVLFIRVIRMLAMDTTLWSDDVWVVDSTPVECGRSRETARRSDAAGWAQYGYCASHTRYFWGLRLHLVCTLSGLPVLFALAGAKADERETLLDMLEAGQDVVNAHLGQTLIGDKNYFGRAFEKDLTERELALLRPARKGEARRPGQHLFKPLRQVIESVNWTFKGQLDLERHGGRTPEGIIARVLARVLALTAAIWHNDKTAQPVKRSLIAFDH